MLMLSIGKGRHTKKLYIAMYGQWHTGNVRCVRAGYVLERPLVRIGDRFPLG